MFTSPHRPPVDGSVAGACVAAFYQPRSSCLFQAAATAAMMSTMRDTRWLPILLFLGLLAAACESDDEFIRLEPPPNDGVYSYANGCFAVEGFDGERTPQHLTVGSSDDTFAFVEPDADAASRFTMRATDLGTYLFFDQEQRYFTADAVDGGPLRFLRAETLDSPLTVLDADFRSPAEWELEPSVRDPQRFQLKQYRSGRYLSLSGLTDEPTAAAIITLLPKEGCAEFPELSIDAAGSVTPQKWDDDDLFGIAEIHSHMLTNIGFGGGGTFHGSPFHRLGVEHALPDCEMWHGPEGRRDVVGYFYDGDGGALDVDALTPILTTGEVPDFNHFTAGYPDFVDWPNPWRRATHQTMYYRWLERAHLAGLRLLVQHATGNSVLCDLVTGIGSQTSLYSCNDMISVDRQIAEAYNLERYIDAQAGGPGKGWLRVVDSPAQARTVIEEGKLAVVLGIEISNLFDCFLTPREGFPACDAASVRDKLDHYRDMGVRVVFPVHKFDNAFAPGDGSDGIIELGNLINSGHYSNFVEDCPGPSAGFDGGDVTFGGLNQPRTDYASPAPIDMSEFGLNPVGALLPLVEQIQEPALSGEFCQQHGMTPLGETLMQELMQRGMMVDIAHLPQRALGRAYELLEANQYPATKTHGNTNGGRIYQHGGMAGTSLGRCGVPGQPGAMGTRLKQSVQEAVDNGAYPSEALAFDLNGFAHGPRPRFGEDSPCTEPQTNPVSYPFSSYDGKVTFEQPYVGNREVDFNAEGMIHIGLLPELIEDARRDGVTDEELEPLFRSAEAYIRMWERAESQAATLQP